MSSPCLRVHFAYNCGCASSSDSEKQEVQGRGWVVHYSAVGACCWTWAWTNKESLGKEGTAASNVGRSIASVPSCMPCMSFLVFEALFLSKKKKEEQMRQVICTTSLVWRRDG